jgi:flagellar biosynthesis/type III secretory pathway protein FliH
MSNAERQAQYRQRRKEQGLKRRDNWVTPKADSNQTSTIREQEREDRRARWEAEAQEEKLKAAREEGRRLARNADRSRATGYIDGLCTAAAFFVRIDRVDIAQSLLGYYTIDRNKAAAALEADKRTKSATLETLEYGGVFDADGQPVKVFLTML